MTMTIDNQQRHHLGLGYDSMSYPAHSPPSPHPHFGHPWAASASAATSNAQLFPSVAASSLAYGPSKPPSHRTSAASPMPYLSVPPTAPPMGVGSYLPHLPLSPSYDHAYSGRPPQASGAYASSGASYAPIESYSQALVQQQQHQNEQPLAQPTAPSHATFGDPLDGARGIVALGQDITPRNIYGPRGDRGVTDSYGFPSATHSAHSSVSSGSVYPAYFGGSVESSVSEYSSASESAEGIGSRTLPRPSGLLAHLPPRPQSMMGSFSSKVSANTQKKHKCKVCDKRFTRPSSLQTHMYSHTGEKPFACEVPGCGRNFSVVSNLRRHHKVHKGDHADDPADDPVDDPADDHGSPEGSWTSRD